MASDGARRSDPSAGSDPVRAGFAALVISALGVVYGDIGTRPPLSVLTVFSLDGGRIRPTAAAVVGIVSIVAWTLTVVVSMKYVTIVLRGDNMAWATVPGATPPDR